MTNAPDRPAPPRTPSKRAKPRGGGFSRSVVLVALLVGLALGRFACGSSSPDVRPPEQAPATASVWTCSMHPQIRASEPGLCPICSMDLIPVSGSDDAGLDPRALSMSAHAAALAEVVVAPVEQRAVSRELRLVGKVTFDETRLSYITAWVPSRLDRLYVDYTGISVRKGDHMAEVYSPDLIATQQQLLQAIATERRLQESPVDTVRSRQAGSVKSARDRLRLWGLNAEQIDEVVARGEPLELITIHSPVAGIVVHKNALQGEYVQTGTRIYTIADLTRVWVQLDAYETDLAWLHYGQQVEFVSEAWPGETFHGRVSFIDPVLDDRTRTVKVRLNVDNTDLRLKPEMFVRATVTAPVTAAGRPIDPELADMWMCPMHPEVVSVSAGECSICGMDLAPTEELGFRSVAAEELPLVIPSTAPLITGKRAVVYVQLAGTERPTFVGRDVTLGPRAGDWYVVYDGLVAGELVVTHGAFKIDSELQIRGAPSMMNPAGGAAPPGHGHATPGAEPGDHGGAHAPLPVAGVPDAFREQLGALVGPYLELQQALAADESEAARSAAPRFSAALGQIDMALLDTPAHSAWMERAGVLSDSAQQLSAEPGIEAQRLAFRSLSAALIGALDSFGPAHSTQRLAVFHCSMAFDAGADWLQSNDEAANPYFGATMLRCGDRVRVLEAGAH